MNTLPIPEDIVSAGLTTENVVKLSNDALERAKQRAQEITSLKDVEQLTWQNTMEVFDDLLHAVQESISLPALLGVTHKDPEVRKAAMSCEPKVDQFISELYLNPAIAEVIRRFAQQKPSLTSTQQKFLDEVLREYRRNGLELNEEGQQKLRELNEELTKLSQDFDRVLAETTLSLEVQPEQLKGLPETFIANHPVQENGMIRLTTDYPDLVPFLRYAKDRDTARELYILSENRGAESNIPTLKKVLKLREEKAKLLGYTTWADFVLETRMAKNPEKVKTFLKNLHEKLSAKREEEAQILLEMGKKHISSSLKKISVSDVKYLEEEYQKEKFSLNSQVLSEYFEGTKVLKGIMDISSRLFNIQYRQIEARTWHEEVQVFDVMRGDTHIGRIYLDLYPREGKYKHAAMFDIRNTKHLEDGTRIVPMCALVCNFPKPGASPALMSHDDVTTFFHEFGHLLHHILSQASLASFAGTNVARDFVETPSQIFENWAWNKDVLATFARHYQTGEILPDDLYDAMTTARAFGQAIATERQLFLANLDMELHTRDANVDPEQLVLELYPNYSSFERLPGTRFPATFGHLMGYSAAYYSYQWALSLAYDIFTRFENEGLMNPQTAQEYLHEILEKGSTEDEEKLVKNFLGREPNEKAYLRFLGVENEIRII
ncbi:oligopeptidase A [bacterium]|nr:oligopeptidase A [bacterium]